MSDDTDTVRRCQKCGEPTGGEEAWIQGQIWCHPCADALEADAMSDDIVKRLRDEIDVDANEPIDRLMDEAADEIERLREAIAMAANRLDVALASDADIPVCKHCVDVALSYLRPSEG